MGNEDLKKGLQAREAQRRASREDLLRPRKYRQEVFIEGLDAVVTLQSLSQEARQEIQEKSRRDDGQHDAEYAGLLTIVASVVEPELTEADVKELKKQDAAIIDELHIEIAKMNMMGATAKDLKVVSELIPQSDSDLSRQNGSG